MTNNIQEQTWQAGLERTLRRLKELARLEAEDKQPSLTATRAYSRFKDNLMAAGYRRALAEPKDEVYGHLRVAGEAAIEVFRWHGTTISKITHLPSFETETFIDDSMINPETFADACYAFVLGGSDSQLSELCDAAREAGLFEDKMAEADALAVARALAGLLSSDDDLKKLLNDNLQTENLGEDNWGNQLKCLHCLIARDSDAFANRLQDYQRSFDKSFDKAGRPNDPARLLALPIEGLQALANRLAHNKGR